ncbi:hypothetical protein [Oceanirhabdus seepicola]|uniref:4Fe-4S ferredoxin-type domain-containing protein n=1 Tax=Oceanirhabdus seepicola TaxID=2828781 RepID=A0A9J6P7G0_9CLOT|nr:hypothetical protein [Oceanirhabdus seepicola]MCM1991749.1 hypothetical protein [Oceanirhabdus seepicola]
MEYYNKQEVTKNVKEMLSAFRLLGVSSRERFENEEISTLKDKHPKKILENFQSVIVFGDGTHKKDKNTHEPLSFNDHVELLTSPTGVVKYLNSLGYKSHIIHKSNIDVSLVDMAVKAGVGELSPVNSLVVRGYGLTPVIQAIVTEAPLVQDDLPEPKTHCIKCNLCLKACPIRDKAYVSGDMSKCACNKCVKVCPV